MLSNRLKELSDTVHPTHESNHAQTYLTTTRYTVHCMQSAEDYLQVAPTKYVHIAGIVDTQVEVDGHRNTKTTAAKKLIP